MFLANTDDRAARYSLLDQTWTLAQVLMLRPGRASYPSGLDGLWGLRIAVDRGSINHRLLESLPSSRQPTLVVTSTRGEAVAAFERGDVDGVAGNHLATRALLAGHDRGGGSAAHGPALPARGAARARGARGAAPPGAGPVEGRRRIRPSRRDLPDQPDPADMARSVRVAARRRRGRGGAALHGLVGLEPLAPQAGAGPRRGDGANRAALSRPRGQRQRHDLPHRSVRAVHLRQPRRGAHPRLHGARAADDAVLRVDAAGLRAARDGVLRAVGEVARDHVPRVPGAHEGRPRAVGGPARAADPHQRAHRRLPGIGARHHRPRPRAGRT